MYVCLCTYAYIHRHVHVCVCVCVLVVRYSMSFSMLLYKKDPIQERAESRLAFELTHPHQPHCTKQTQNRAYNSAPWQSSSRSCSLGTLQAVHWGEFHQ